MNEISNSRISATVAPLMLNFPELVEFFFRRWKFIAGVAAFSTAAATWFVLQATPIYSATTQILLEVPSENVIGSDRVIAQRNLGSEIVESQIIVIRSIALLRQVVEDLNLNEDPEFLPSEASWNDTLYRSVTGWFAENSREMQAGASEQKTDTVVILLARTLGVSRVGTSNIIEVSARSSSASKAAELSNAVANAYVADQVDARHERARRASIWLNERMALQRKHLEASESAVEKFRIENNLLTTREGSITEQQLSELNLGLIGAQAEVVEKRSRYLQVQRLLDQGDDLQSVPDVLRSVAVAELRRVRAEAARVEADLLSKYGDRHPDLSRVRSELQEMDQQIRAEVERVVANLRNELEVAESRAVSLEMALASATGQSGTDNQLAVALRELERVAASDRELYESFLARARLAQEEVSMNIAEARIISPALVAESPTYPRKKLSVILGLIFGVGAGICGAVIKEASRRGYLVEPELEEAMELPVLASVPRVAEWKNGSSHVINDLTNREFWRYNAAIENVGFGTDGVSPFGTHHGATQVTSSMPGEGKTTLAISLAISAAAAGYRVLLVDGDLRRAGTTKAFDLGDKTGLVDVLADGAHLNRAIHLDQRTGVHVLPAGASSTLQRTLLGSPRMRSLLDHLLPLFDEIIIDSPPVAVTVDALLISRLVEKVIFAVLWNHTPREAIQRSVNKLKVTRRNIELVMTMVEDRQLPRYGRYAAVEADAMRRYHMPS